ncbi:MAG: hypothetical protein Q3994_03790 [Prevotella sp.]|nr:hypothetical protein [Prevotella sp.]
MATISLKYDGRNILAKKTIDYILSIGLFTRTDNAISVAEKKTRKAIKEIENGKGIVCNSFEEFVEAMK